MPVVPQLAAPDWDMVGSLSEAVAALTALFALLVAALAARATIETNRAQQRSIELQRQQLERVVYEQRRRAEDKHRRQAERVAAWYGLKKRGPISVPVFFLRNASDVPVYAVTAYVLEPDPGPVRRVLDIQDTPVLPPTSDPVVLTVRVPSEFPRSRYEEVFEVGMYFRDASGQFWHRDTDGVLYAISESDYKEGTTDVTSRKWEDPSD